MFPAPIGIWRNLTSPRNKSVSRYARAFRLKLCEPSSKNRQIFKLKNSVLMLLFMSFHFTQICAFQPCLFVFMGYYSCFYRCKNRQFFKSKCFLEVFLPQITATAVPAASLSGSPWRHPQKKVLHRIEKVVEKTSFYIATSKKVVSLQCQIVVRGREQFAFAAIFKLDHSDSHIRT